MSIITTIQNAGGEIELSSTGGLLARGIPRDYIDTVRTHRSAIIASLAECLGCSRCGDNEPEHLYSQINPAYWLCSRCWKAAGQPGSTFNLPPDHEREEQIRREMLARGGADRHMVRVGRT